MKFMMFVKSNDQIETGVLPNVEEFEEMNKYNDQLKKAGALISLDGFHPSSKGARVAFENGYSSVSKGPFPNSKELVAGYWQIEVKSLNEAVEWAKKVPFKDGVVEIRQIYESSDFPPEIKKAVGL